MKTVQQDSVKLLDLAPGMSNDRYSAVAKCYPNNILDETEHGTAVEVAVTAEVDGGHPDRHN
jgi:hypothetical protein